MAKGYEHMNRVELMMELKRLIALGTTGAEEAREAEQELIRVQTEQLVEAQRLLEESRDRYFELYDSAPIAYTTLEVNGVIIELNTTACRLLGLDETIVGRSLRWLVEPCDRRSFTDHLRRCRAASAESSGGEQIRTELTLKTAQAGRIRVQLISSPSAPCTPGEAAPLCYRTALMDLTQLRAVEEAQRVSEERLRLALEGAGAGIWELDAATLHLSWTTAPAKGPTGPTSRTHVPLPSGLNWIHPDDRVRVLEDIHAALAGRKDAIRFECRSIPSSPDGVTARLREDRIPGSVPPPGRERWLLCVGRAVRDVRGRTTGLRGIHVDITDRLQAQQELAQHRDHLEELVLDRTSELERTHQKLRLSERMAALGTLSAGLGHDMGNLLMPVRVRLESLESRGLDSAAAEDIQAIRRCVDYLQRLASGLRMFSLDPIQSSGSESGTILEEWWRDGEAFFRNAIPRGVVLGRAFDTDLPPLALSRQALTQAVFNLIQNAGDAMKARGHGHITVWARPADETGRRILLGVTDDGPGMSPEVRQRCLEPFFTTKPRQFSTGMGLSLVHGIVQQSGGGIQIDTEAGKGTSFVLTLPARPRARDNGDAAHPAHPSAAMELKDPRTRGLITAMLRKMEFDIVSVDAGGADAAAPRVLITDDRARASAVGPADQIILLLGDAPTPRRTGRTLELSRPPRPAHLREALEEVRRELSLEPAHGR